ncbi:Flagellar hook-associated protein 2 [Poriferisphaera corsica]|uniref:Filament cap protein n=1 Tax=Poriferisphaera corsica TaxID=2528020 RepID=A0A517YT16_9BACT|nr:flagellar filament capping protein FliD [Poriferisphaera corsica]QDU33302.1 Flagellar hook-associated protein 2 [Poriferisphaera corsica]
MGQITTSVGLISGIDSGALIDQLIQLDSKPKTLIEQKNLKIDTQKTAYQTVNAQLLALKGQSSNLGLPTTFNATLASTSNESVLTATTSKTAVPGNYSFIVKQLVASQQTVTKGFGAKDDDLGLTNTMTFEPGGARLDSTSKLSAMNGGEGVERGVIRVTDRSGNAAFIDLGTAVTVDDVVDTINNTLGVNVIASITQDGLTIRDNTGSTSGSLIIEDVGKTKTATSLGIKDSVASDTLVGSSINRVGRNTLLSDLNDGNGIHMNQDETDDFRIKTNSGEFTVDLGKATTLGDVIDKINEAATTAGISVTADISADGTGLALNDGTGSGTDFRVNVINGSQAAVDLGIEGYDADGDGVMSDRLIASINSKLLKNINGGDGITNGWVGLTGSTSLSLLNNGEGIKTSGNSDADLTITDRDGDSYAIDIDGLSTIQELIDHVESETGGVILLSFSDGHLIADDDSGGSGEFQIESTSGSVATAESLGLAAAKTEDTITGLDLSNLQPNNNSGMGIVRIKNAAGDTKDVDLSAARSVSDVARLINESGAGVEVKINNNGNGLQIEDKSGGSGALEISDVSGKVAESFNLNGTHTSRLVDGGNVQMQYISEATTLESLGVTRGKFKITDSSGRTATVDLTQGNEVTLADVISEINSRGLKIQASINENGDGILLRDMGPGTVKIKVEEDGSSTASDLGFLGEAAEPGEDLDGSFEKKIEVEATDSLQEIATKINDANLNMRATIINDGSGNAPFRLSMTTREPGTDGAFVFDDGGAGFNAFNLAEAQDAVVFYGTGDAADALAVTSSSNTIKNLVPGVTIDLKSTSTSPIQVTIAEDNEAIRGSVKGFVDAFNDMLATINKYDTYDADTNTRGLLFGDSATSQITRSIYNSVLYGNPEVPGRYHSLSEVGVTVGSGGKLRFDATKFDEAIQEDRDAVIDLFTWRQTEKVDEDGDGEKDEEKLIASGIGVELDLLIKRLSDKDSSPIERAIGILDAQKKLNDQKIKDLDARLAAKRERLVRDFTNMEKSLAKMQGQTSSISQIQSITTNNSK